jgi:hypothetical protein
MMSVYIVHFFRSIVRFLSAPYVLITATAIAFIAVAIIYLAHDNNPEESSTICQDETCLQARTVVFYSVSSDNSHDEPCSEKSLDRLSNIVIPISSTMEQYRGVQIYCFNGSKFSGNRETYTDHRASGQRGSCAH